MTARPPMPCQPASCQPAPCPPSHRPSPLGPSSLSPCEAARALRRPPRPDDAEEAAERPASAGRPRLPIAAGAPTASAPAATSIPAFPGTLASTGALACSGTKAPPRRGARRLARIGAAMAALVALALAACAPNAANMASPAPDQPWVPHGTEAGLWSLERAPKAAPPGTTPNFRIPATPALAAMPPPPGLDLARTYRLPELIDLAQRSNPATKVAWHQARQAALAVGMVEAAYLPVITASVVGGRQQVDTPVQDPLGKTVNVTTTEEGSTQILALQWLIFDFGQRQAVAAAAKQGAIAANVLFNGAHQKLIFDVAQAYYLYGAAVQQRGFAETAVRNAKAIRSAADGRAAQGLATSVETAQAAQAVAQAELRRVEAEGVERDAYQALLAAVGVQAPLKVDAAAAARRPLPAPAKVPLDATIRLALSRRPDVAASYAALQAGRSGVKAAQAEYLPKVYAGGNMAWGQGDFDVGGLPTIGQQGSGTGLLMGVTVPLYESGLRQAGVRQAQSRAAAAEEDFRRVQTAAVTEIVAARNALATALESHRAAAALAKAAGVTYDAAFAAYRNGVGTVDAATAADTALLDARAAQAEAHAAALVGAASLAFAVGALTSRETLP